MKVTHWCPGCRTCCQASSNKSPVHRSLTTMTHGGWHAGQRWQPVWTMVSYWRDLEGWMSWRAASKWHAILQSIAIYDFDRGRYPMKSDMCHYAHGMFVWINLQPFYDKNRGIWISKSFVQCVWPLPSQGWEPHWSVHTASMARPRGCWNFAPWQLTKGIAMKDFTISRIRVEFSLHSRAGQSKFHKSRRPRLRFIGACLMVHPRVAQAVSELWAVLKDRRLIGVCFLHIQRHLNKRMHGSGRCPSTAFASFISLNPLKTVRGCKAGWQVTRRRDAKDPPAASRTDPWLGVFHCNLQQRTHKTCKQSQIAWNTLKHPRSIRSFTRFSRFDAPEDRADLVQMRSAQQDILVDMSGAQMDVWQCMTRPQKDLKVKGIRILLHQFCWVYVCRDCWTQHSTPSLLGSWDLMSMNESINQWINGWMNTYLHTDAHIVSVFATISSWILILSWLSLLLPAPPYNDLSHLHASHVVPIARYCVAAGTAEAQLVLAALWLGHACLIVTRADREVWARWKNFMLL